MIKLKEANTLYICTNEKKEILLKQMSHDKEIFDIKFMTLNEFMEQYFFKYNVNIYPYLMEKYNISFSVAKEYLKYLYYIDLNNNYDSKKISFLQEMKKDLTNNNILIENKQFKEYLNSKNVYVDASCQLDNYLEKIFTSLNAQILTSSPQEKNIIVTQAADIEEEVNNVIVKILELVDNKVSLNHIFLTNISADYFYTLKKLFKMYNIPLELNENISINSVPVIKEYFITKKLPEYNNENKNIIKPFISLLNKYTSISGSKYYKEILKEELKKTYILPPKYQESIKVKDFSNLEVEDDDYVFLLGFNEGVLPLLHKDEDYLSDSDKGILGMPTSVLENEISKKRTYQKITNIKNIYMSYKLHSFDDEFYPSSMIEDYSMNVSKTPLQNMHLSNSYNRRKLCLLLDEYNKYKVIHSDLKTLQKTYKDIMYNSYNHSFKSISNLDYLNYIHKPLKLSYTSINSYNLCPFSYYLKYVLKIDPFEESFQALVGSLYHKVLSTCFDENFDFEYIWQEFLQNKILSAKENFLLKRLKKELLEIIEVLKEQKMYTDFKNAYYEKEITIPLAKYKIDSYFTGIIDKIMFYQNMDDTYYALIDYKTGSFPTSLNNLKYGLDMQLPIYLYLVENSEVFKNPIFAGFYFQKVSLGSITTTNSKDYKAVVEDKLKLKGYSTSDEDILSHFDHNYTKSNIISGMSITKNGFSRYAKLLSEEDVYNILNYTKDKIEKSLINIIDSNFDIKPKVIQDDYKACKNCKFKDICYKVEEDYDRLEKVENLDFLGGDING